MVKSEKRTNEIDRDDIYKEYVALMSPEKIKEIDYLIEELKEINDLIKSRKEKQGWIENWISEWKKELEADLLAKKAELSGMKTSWQTPQSSAGLRSIFDYFTTVTGEISAAEKIREIELALGVAQQNPNMLVKIISLIKQRLFAPLSHSLLSFKARYLRHEESWREVETTKKSFADAINCDGSQEGFNIAKSLLRQGENPLEAINGKNALDLAIEKRKADIINLLVRYINKAGSSDSVTPKQKLLYEIMRNSYSHQYGKMIKEQTIDFKFDEALKLSMERRNLSAFQAIINNKVKDNPDADERDALLSIKVMVSYGGKDVEMTPLSFAMTFLSGKSREACISILLEGGADINCQVISAGGDEEPFLIRFVRERELFPEFCRRFQQYGDALNCSYKKKTLLMLFMDKIVDWKGDVTEENLNFLKELIDTGAKIDYTPEGYPDETVLIDSVRHKNVQVVELLIDKHPAQGKERSLTLALDKTVGYWRFCDDRELREKMIDLLIEKGAKADIKTLEYYGLESKNIKIAKLLIENQSDENKGDALAPSLAKALQRWEEADEASEKEYWAETIALLVKNGAKAKPSMAVLECGLKLQNVDLVDSSIDNLKNMAQVTSGGRIGREKQETFLTRAVALAPKKGDDGPQSQTESDPSPAAKPPPVASG